MNHELAAFIREQANGTVPPPNRGRSTAYHSPKRRIRERLSVEEIAAIVKAFETGTPKWRLAQQYGIGTKSVKKLLREEGVRKRSGYNPRE